MKKLTVTSPCFENGGLIPIEHTGYGADRSPELLLDCFLDLPVASRKKVLLKAMESGEGLRQGAALLSGVLNIVFIAALFLH
ncbi:hypothetical protein [Qiania dongpingensis]|uniref:Uncharacterized protein n=1 Tax=Qiania dongpingensis TaxID=2763669 RepID=A0A7G9G2Y1_9FIRM|nr:hypothetical protein [Qiania dongpingensis]QNM05163.1 hypothetical protein H9Q78_12050 [Qiania dongpingensis]